MTTDRELSERLSSLAERTATIRARPDFSARVMAKVSGEPPFALGALPRTAWRLLPVALAAAVLSFGWALTSGHRADEALALTYDAAELEW